MRALLSEQSGLQRQVSDATSALAAARGRLASAQASEEEARRGANSRATSEEKLQEVNDALLPFTVPSHRPFTPRLHAVCSRLRR